MHTRLSRFRVAISSLALFFVAPSVFAANPTPPRGGGPGVQPATSPSAATASISPPRPGAIDERLFKGMQWRQIGPYRGGRALAVEGVPGEPDTYYFGAVAGGGWKKGDCGQKLTPLFDKKKIFSNGAIAGAPSE